MKVFFFEKKVSSQKFERYQKTTNHIQFYNKWIVMKLRFKRTCHYQYIIFKFFKETIMKLYN